MISSARGDDIRSPRVHDHDKAAAAVDVRVELDIGSDRVYP
jgi:hypothetical protein